MEEIAAVINMDEAALKVGSLKVGDLEVGP
jgi:hypothetical protein